MATLFRPDRPKDDVLKWYVQRKERCIEQIWKQVCGLMAADLDVVLELGLVQRTSRMAFYDRMNSAGYQFTVCVLDAPRGERRARVANRNREKGETYAMDVPEAIFEIASDLWEAPDAAECQGRDIRFISTG